MSATVSSPIPSRLRQSLVGPAATSRGPSSTSGCGDGARRPRTPRHRLHRPGDRRHPVRAADGLVQGSLSATVPFAVADLRRHPRPRDEGLLRPRGPARKSSPRPPTCFGASSPAAGWSFSSPRASPLPVRSTPPALNACARALLAVPGRCDVSPVRGWPWGFLLSLKWLMGEKKIAATIVSMTVPSPALGRLEWHRVVRDILLGKKKRGAA